jgi:hypothetical protein
MGLSRNIQTLRIPEHLIGISTNTPPTQRLHLINDVLWVRAIGRQIAAMENQVRRDLTQIGENRFEGTPVAVNVGDNCDSYPSLPPNTILDHEFLSAQLGQISPTM